MRHGRIGGKGGLGLYVNTPRVGSLQSHYTRIYNVWCKFDLRKVEALVFLIAVRTR